MNNEIAKLDQSTEMPVGEFLVHYMELSAYNNAQIVGKWFALDGLTVEEHMAEVKEWLKELSANYPDGQIAEEYILGDVEGIPKKYASDFGIDHEFFELMDAVENSHLDIEIFLAGIECDIPIENIEESYAGSFKSDEDLAWSLIDDGCFGEIPDNLVGYLDIEKMARDLMFDYVASNGHYFNRNA